MLRLKNITFQIGEKLLFRDINWVINPGQRLALIGANGCGKTTLFRLIIGDLAATMGEIQKPNTYSIGYLPQEELVFGTRSLLKEVMDGREEIITMEQELAGIQGKLSDPALTGGQKQKLIEQLGHLEHKYAQTGGYTLEAEVKKILMGLGFSENQFYLPLSRFSGGWRMRVYLARLLIQKPDLLLLDEPTNHLDLPSLEWLETYLTNFTGSVIIVSHDRFFIDRMVEGIGSIENKTFTYYAGNYHFYEMQKHLRQEQLLKKAEEIRSEKVRINRFIERFRYKATKAAQVQSRIKMLEKLEEVEIPETTRQIHFQLKVSRQSFKHVCGLKDVHFSYGNTCVLENLNVDVYRGDKIALVGINGAGKTTFGRLLYGELKPTKGDLQYGQNVSIGYYAQHQIDSLNLEHTIFEEVLNTAAPDFRTQLRDILGLFRFSGKDIEKKISVLSGGEKARVSLAKILLSPVNFLIMDEPTNHLDIQAQESLEEALVKYDGTLLLVSHDRYFLDKIVKRVWEIKDGHLFQFEGNYTNFLNKKQTQVEERFTSKPVIRKEKERKRIEAEARQQISSERNKLNTKIKDLEKEIETLEEEFKKLEESMGSPDFYKNVDESVQGTRRYHEIKTILDEKYTCWEQTEQHLDMLLNGLKNG